MNALNPRSLSVDVVPIAGVFAVADLVRRLRSQLGFTALLGGGADGDAAHAGRWSIFCAEPIDSLELAAGTPPSADVRPFDALRALLAAAHAPPPPDGLPFAGGVIAMLGYDLRIHTEVAPDQHAPDRACPELLARVFDAALCHDGTTGRVFAARLVDAADPLFSLRSQRRVAVWESLLTGGRAPVTASADTLSTPTASASAHNLTVPTCALTVAAYRARIAEIHERIRAGDVYQVNFAQRFDGPAPADLDAFMARLLTLNPAPFGGLVSLGDDEWLASASPERFLKVDGAQVVTRPIKGTVRRGRTAAEDAAKRTELLASAKDRAELAMIIDLLRNDLSRNCAPGTVRVAEALTLETHPTVHHLVATITGTLEPGRDVIDLVRDAWPGGSISGVPKISALGVIDALETARRGPYTGSLGWFGFDGRADLNILIRSARISGDRAWVWGGGGITIDSDPESERLETLAKVRGLCAALGWGELT